MGKVTVFPKVGVCMRAVLLDAVEAQGNGEWICTEGFEKFSIHVIISNTATVQVRLSNEANPDNSDDGIQLGSDISASGFVDYDRPVRNIKVKVSGYTSGAVTALLEAV